MFLKNLDYVLSAYHRFSKVVFRNLCCFCQVGEVFLFCFDLKRDLSRPESGVFFF